MSYQYNIERIIIIESYKSIKRRAALYITVFLTVVRISTIVGRGAAGEVRKVRQIRHRGRCLRPPHNDRADAEKKKRLDIIDGRRKTIFPSGAQIAKYDRGRGAAPNLDRECRGGFR